MSDRYEAFADAIADMPGFYKHVSRLNDDQRKFLDLLETWFANKQHQFVTVSGAPGSGKTYAVIETLNLFNIPQLRLAFTRRIARNIMGRTIHSALNIPFGTNSEIDKCASKFDLLECETNDYLATCMLNCDSVAKQMCYRGHDLRRLQIIVIDEIGMIPCWLLQCVVDYFMQTNADRAILFIGMGDQCQLKPIGCRYNGVQTSLLRPVKPIPLVFEKNQRFDPDYDLLIRQMKTKVLADDVAGFFELIRANFPVKEENVSADECDLVLAYKNVTIQKYNEDYLKTLPGSIIEFPRIVHGRHMGPNLQLKVNCLVVCKHNVSLAVSAGREFRFVKYDPDSDVVILRDQNNARHRVIRIDGQFPIRVGFAVTIHCFQGETIEHKVLFDFDDSSDLHLIYTGLSRVRSMHQIHAIVNLLRV